MNKLRVCKYKDMVCYFHDWYCAPDMKLYALLEFPDGTMHICIYDEIIFKDEQNNYLSKINKHLKELEDNEH